MSNEQTVFYSLIPRYKTVNREQKRAMQFELDRMAYHVIELEDEFITEVMAENEVSYKELYERFKNKFKALCAFMKTVYQPKYWIVNEQYFDEKLG